MKRLQATIEGNVQGVGFREFVRTAAVARGITGYVCNGHDDESVDVVAEGDDARLAELLAELRRGPRFARVDSVAFEYSEASGGFSRFGVEM